MQRTATSTAPSTSPEGYPLKIVSRSLSRQRALKLRMAWFVIGTAFGTGCISALSPLLGSASWQSVPEVAQVPVEPPPVASETVIALPAEPLALDRIVSASPDESKGEEIAQPVVLSSAPEAQPGKSAPVYPLSLELKVENGDTLISLLTDSGISYDEAQSAVDEIRKVYDPKRLDVGQNVTVRLDRLKGKDSAPMLAGMTLPLSPTTALELSRGKAAGGFSVKKVDAPVSRKLARAGGSIKGSLYETAVRSGLPPALMSEIISAYSYDVDFQRDIQPGDKIDVLYDRLQTAEGVNAGRANLLFANLDLGDRELRVYRYAGKDGQADYYNDKGESVRKALLRTPINGAKITSGFGMRSHPILGYSKMHRGVDFGASLGTPIYASGDGSVEFVGKKGGYGNYLKIKHNDKYASAYGHISRFASGVAPGRKVKQGQIVAYVGATGMATGPHLHYEILVAGEQVNPANVKFKTGNILQGRELLAFRKNMGRIDAQLAALTRGDSPLAMAETSPAAVLPE